MRVKIVIPIPLRQLSKGKEEIFMEGESVIDVINNLDVSYPGIKERLIDGEGKVRQFVNIYLNEIDIRSLNGMMTETKEGDVITIIPAIAGGVTIT